MQKAIELSKQETTTKKQKSQQPEKIIVESIMDHFKNYFTFAQVNECLIQNKNDVDKTIE